MRSFLRSKLGAHPVENSEGPENASSFRDTIPSHQDVLAKHLSHQIDVDTSIHERAHARSAKANHGACALTSRALLTQASRKEMREDWYGGIGSRTQRMITQPFQAMVVVQQPIFREGVLAILKQIAGCARDWATHHRQRGA